MSYYKDFRADGDFGAMRAAEDWLRERGFSVGSTCSGYPRAIMYGDYSIAKWRNLGREEIRTLHGVMRSDVSSGSFRGAGVVIELLDRAPADAIAAFREPAHV